MFPDGSWLHHCEMKDQESNGHRASVQLSAILHKSGLIGGLARWKSRLNKRIQLTLKWLFSWNSKHHRYGEAWGCFWAAGTKRLIRIEGRMNASNTEGPWRKSAPECTCPQTGTKFDHSARQPQQAYVEDNIEVASGQVSECPQFTQPKEHLWRDLKVAKIQVWKTLVCVCVCV